MDKTPETYLEFPCEFPIKAMGRMCNDLDALVVGIIRRHVPDIGEGAVHTRTSRQGNYLSVTVTITAHSREQLDMIYRDLTACEEILLVL